MRSNIKSLKSVLYMSVAAALSSGCATPTTKCAGSGPLNIGTISDSGGGGGVIGGTRSYSITDLGTFGGSNSSANGINDSQQVVGMADTKAGMHHAFLWQNSIMTDIGTLGGANSEANAIGGTGSDVVGVSDISGGMHHGFLYRAGKLSDLGTLGGANSSALGIQSPAINGDTIVGVSDISASASHGFTVTIPIGTVGKIALTDLGTLGGKNSTATCVVFSSTAGSSDTTAGAIHAVSVDPNLNRTDLGTLGGENSSALGISVGQSPGNQIVGTSDVVTIGVTHAFLWEVNSFPGTANLMADLGTLGGKNSTANAINNSGQIVGVSDIATGGQHAFLYSNNVMTDLNSTLAPGVASKWVLETATAINTFGNIVGTGKIGGVNHAFLLSPQ